MNIQQLREKVLSTDDVKRGEIEVPEWDVTLPIQSLSAKDMKTILAKSKDGKGVVDEVRLSCLSVLYGCKTAEGERVFTDADLAVFEDRKSMKAITTVSAEILRISGYSKEDVNDAKKD